MTTAERCVVLSTPKSWAIRFYILRIQSESKVIFLDIVHSLRKDTILKVERYKKRVHICWRTPQMPATTRLGQVIVRSPEFHPCLPNQTQAL